MSVDTDEEHLVRAVWATRFVDADASELAALIVQTEGGDLANAAASRFRNSRDRLMYLAACCEAAARVMAHATEPA